MTAVIAFASRKGGVGKSTAAICLATEWDRRGKKVSVIDADPNRPVFQWFERAAFPGIRCIDVLDHNVLMQKISEFKKDSDFVLIDLQGSNNDLMVYSFGRASLVLIPVQASNFDVVSALATADLVTSASTLLERQIPLSFMLTKTVPRVELRVARHARNQFVKRGFPTLPVEFAERVAFREMTFNLQPPNIASPLTTAANNVQRLADAIEVTLGLREPSAAPDATSAIADENLEGPTGEGAEAA